MTDRPRVVVVGLGPGGPDLLTAGTLAAIDAVQRAVPAHQSAPGRSGGAGRRRRSTTSTTPPTTIDEVYPAIVELLVEAAAGATARSSTPCPAPRSSPSAPSSSCWPTTGSAVEVLPALSFLDLAWVRLGVDPVAVGVRVVDGHRFAVEAAGERGPLLVAQCDSAHVLSDVKLALDAGPDPTLGPDAHVVVLQRLGLPDERVESVPWAELDRVEADHLTSVYLPELAAPVARELARFAELVAVLRAECPWDREQTHESLRRHLLEESYEVLEAIDHLDEETGEGYEHLEEELGDLLFQVLFHAQLADRGGPVHRRRRRHERPRQARQPATRTCSATSRRPTPTPSWPTGSRSRRRRRAARACSTGCPTPCPPCSTP